MRFTGIAALAASALLIAPAAFAQGSNHSANPTTGQSANNETTGSSASQSGQDDGQMRQHLVQSLQKAGFTHVRVEPEAFIVHALNEQGQPVLMQITPDSMEAVTAIPNQSGNSGSSGQQSGSSGMGQQHSSSGRTTQ